MSIQKGYMLIIDVAHPPRPPAEVEAALVSALARVRESKLLRAIKVVHGYGSHGRGGSTRETVRDWAYQFRQRFRGIIPGEDYSIFNPATQKLRQECGQLDDSDLDKSNLGITILWVN